MAPRLRRNHSDEFKATESDAKKAKLYHER